MAGLTSKENGKKGGRPKGSLSKPRLSDYLKPKEVEALVQVAKDMALKGDTLMLKFVLEQHFGKAIQPTDITSQGEQIQSIVYLPAKPQIKS